MIKDNIAAEASTSYRLPVGFHIEYETARLHFLFEGKPFDLPIKTDQIMSGFEYLGHTEVPEADIERWAITDKLLLGEYKAAVAEIDRFLDERITVTTEDGTKEAKRREMVTRVMLCFKPLPEPTIS